MVDVRKLRARHRNRMIIFSNYAHPMASPIPTGKQPVNLASGASGARVSRIRRDPPPPAAIEKQVEIDQLEQEQWGMVVGVVTLALAFFAIIFGLGISSGWSLSQYTLEL